MLALYDHPDYEDAKTCHLYKALEAAMQIEKKKIIVGPRDSVGIVLFNTVSWHNHSLRACAQVYAKTMKNKREGHLSDLKDGTYLFQPISLLSASKVKELIEILEGKYVCRLFYFFANVLHRQPRRS